MQAEILKGSGARVGAAKFPNVGGSYGSGVGARFDSVILPYILTNGSNYE